MNPRSEAFAFTPGYTPPPDGEVPGFVQVGGVYVRRLLQWSDARRRRGMTNVAPPFAPGWFFCSCSSQY
jgi:hypothetical protein